MNKPLIQWHDGRGLLVDHNYIAELLNAIGKSEEEFMGFFDKIDKKHHLHFLDTMASAALWSGRGISQEKHYKMIDIGDEQPLTVESLIEQLSEHVGMNATVAIEYDGSSQLEIWWPKAGKT